MARENSQAGSSGNGDTPPRPRRTRAAAAGAGREDGLNAFDREVLGALADFRDALRAGTPPGTKYTVRRVAVVVPPPQLGPEDVKRARERLGVSQPVFADFLGTSASTVRSWEQGRKSPSPMARRLLGLMADDPPYWERRFRAMVGPPAAGGVEARPDPEAPD